MSPSTATLADRDAFLEALRSANILTVNQLTKAKAIAPSGSAGDVANTLVTASLLTRFQADRLLSGRTDGFILGQHVILDQIGRGTMSRVYKAKHRTMNRPVAIKVLSSELTRTAADRQNFQLEIRAAGKLAHPNIVTAYDANELHDRFYLVLEFVDGPNLEAFVRQRGPLPVGEACEFIRQVAEGLRHAHEKGMVHRDIKPANLLVARPTPSAPLTVKIADFGIPKASRNAADYGAPEQYAPNALPVDHRADLYSLGCVFYFLLTGRPPFAGGTPEEKVRRHLWEEAPPLFQIRPDLPPDVAAIVHRLLAKNPAARFASAAELLPHLEVACVPIAMVVDEVCFDMPVYAGHPGHDSGFLTGREPVPHGSGGHIALPGSDTFSMPAAEPSPWSQLTDESVNEGDTVPVQVNETPHTPPPVRKLKPKPDEDRETVPFWLTVTMLLGAAVLALLGIAVFIKMMTK